jgi:hypothetical protein
MSPRLATRKADNQKVRAYPLAGFFADAASTSGPIVTTVQCPHGIIGTVEIEFCGDPAIILSLIAI